MRCGKGKGGDPDPSASSAACDDDRTDKDNSSLHVQESVAQRDVLLSKGRCSTLDKGISDDDIRLLLPDVSETPAFHDSSVNC